MSYPEHLPLQEMPAAPPPDQQATLLGFRNGSVPFSMPERNFFTTDHTFWMETMAHGTVAGNDTFIQMGMEMGEQVGKLLASRPALLRDYGGFLRRATSLERAPRPVLEWTQQALGVMAASRFLRELAVAPLLAEDPSNRAQPEVDPYYDPDFEHTWQLAIHLSYEQMRALRLRPLLAFEQQWYTNGDVYVFGQSPSIVSAPGAVAAPRGFDTFAHNTLTPTLKIGAWNAGSDSAG